MWATGTGSDVMKRIAAPMIGGILTSFLLELLVYPPVYQFWKWNFEMKRDRVAEDEPEAIEPSPGAPILLEVSDAP
jgi:Cu(I)/Ag(I) efflux system membrane protein CusA/SilA